MDEIAKLRAQAEAARRFVHTVSDAQTRQVLQDFARECDQKADALAVARETTVPDGVRLS